MQKLQKSKFWTYLVLSEDGRIVYGLVSRYGGSYGGRFVLFGLASLNKNSSLAEIRRMAAFFGKEDLPTIKHPL